MATSTSSRSSRAAAAAPRRIETLSRVTLSTETLDACKRAARALTAYLSVCGEKPLTEAQLQLIRALQMAEISSEQPLYNPQMLMGMVAHFYTPHQLDFAIELLAECLTGEEGEGAAILDELILIAHEYLNSAA